MGIDWTKAGADVKFLHAMVKRDFDICFSYEGMEVLAIFALGEIVMYHAGVPKGEDREPADYLVCQGQLLLTMTKAQFKDRFRLVDLDKLPKGFRFQTFEEFEVKSRVGQKCKIFDFDKDSILQTVVGIDHEADELYVSKNTGEAAPSRALVCRPEIYHERDYTLTWAALTEE